MQRIISHALFSPIFLISISITPTPFNKLHTQLVSAIRHRLGLQNEKLEKLLCASMTSPRRVRSRPHLQRWNAPSNKRKKRRDKYIIIYIIRDDKLHLNYVFNFANHPFNSGLSPSHSRVPILSMGAILCLTLLTPSFDSLYRMYVRFNRIDISAPCIRFWSSAAPTDNHFIWFVLFYFKFFIAVFSLFFENSNLVLMWVCVDGSVVCAVI